MELEFEGKKPTAFHRWLIVQAGRGDEIGFFANEVKGDDLFPFWGDFDTIEYYFIFYAVNGLEVLGHLHEAYREFIRHKAASPRGAKLVIGKPLSFYGWLITQTGRDDPIGDFANDAQRDEAFPRGSSGTYLTVRYRIRWKEDEVLDALRQAYRGYIGYLRTIRAG